MNRSETRLPIITQVSCWLLNGERIDHELCIKRTGYWRLASTIHDLTRRGWNIARYDTGSRHADFKRVYYLPAEEIKRIKKERAAR